MRRTIRTCPSSAWILLLVVQLLPLPLVPAREDTFWNRQSCFLEFAAAGLDIFAFDSYTDWFTEDTVMQLAQAGEYNGPAGIEEYVRFADPTSPYIDGYLDLDQNGVVKTASDPDTGECVIVVTLSVSYRLNPETTSGDSTYTVPAMIKIFYEPQGFLNGVTVSRLNVYYSDEFLELFFGTFLNSDNTRSRVCEILDFHCPHTWTSNGLESIADCQQRLADLPITQDGNDITGKNQGCRALHASIARINDFHCPHISFDAEADDNGSIKCQTASGVLPSTLFDEQDFDIWYNRLEAVGFGVGETIVVCDCDHLSLAEQFYKSIGWASWWETFNSLSPLPPTWIGGSVPKCSLCQ